MKNEKDLMQNEKAYFRLEDVRVGKYMVLEDGTPVLQIKEMVKVDGKRVARYAYMDARSALKLYHFLCAAN